MSDFLRPEARAALWRWREMLAGMGLVAIGLWFALAWFGFIAWLGWAIAALGAALIYTGVQHLRFRTGGDGPGVVEITERRVIYYGPGDGGVADLDLLVRLELSGGDRPAWRLFAETGALLEVPTNAVGAEALFDLFTALPGVRTEAMLSALAAPPRAPVALWQRPHERLQIRTDRSH